MKSSIKLPSELDIMAIPPLAALTVLDIALAMARAAVHCEHINLDELNLYYADGGKPPTSMTLANDISLQSQALRETISKYLKTMTCLPDQNDCVTNLPF